MSNYKSGDFVVLDNSDTDIYQIDHYSNIGNGYIMKCGKAVAYSLVERHANLKELAVGHRILKKEEILPECRYVKKVKNKQAGVSLNFRPQNVVLEQTFEEVFKDAYDYWIDDANTHRFEGAKGLADQIWRHQQTKVNDITEAYAKLSRSDIQNRLRWGDSIKKRDELQKRINKAKEIADDLMQNIENYRVGELLEKILNGDLDEVSKS